jgi:hypothetical protein
MTKTSYLRAYREIGDGQDEPGSPIRFKASTEGVGRDGMVIEAAGWQLDNYRKNPVFLWAHDYFGERLPIGRAEVSTEAKHLVADVTFDQQDEFARKVESKYRRGFLSAVSVGWNTMESQPGNGKPPRITKAELLDVSAVPVPGDPDALKERQIVALRSLTRELERTIRAEPDEGRPWTVVKNGPDDKPFCVYKVVDGQAAGESLGCHETEQGAHDQIAAIGAATHAAPDLWLTVEQMEQLCPSCADEMRRKGFTKINARQMPEQLLDGLCAATGGSFDTCMDTDFGEFAPTDKENFCGWLKGQCAQITSADFPRSLPTERDAVWRGTAAAMAALFAPDCGVGEEARRAIYNSLERIYRKLDRIPPEWRTAEELKALGPDDIAGLFLEGELGTRIGAVLNARNRDDLQQAADLILAVLERAKKEEPEIPSEDGERAAAAFLADLHRIVVAPN